MMVCVCVNQIAQDQLLLFISFTLFNYISLSQQNCVMKERIITAFVCKVFSSSLFKLIFSVTFYRSVCVCLLRSN